MPLVFISAGGYTNNSVNGNFCKESPIYQDVDPSHDLIALLVTTFSRWYWYAVKATQGITWGCKLELKGSKG